MNNFPEGRGLLGKLGDRVVKKIPGLMKKKEVYSGDPKGHKKVD